MRFRWFRRRLSRKMVLGFVGVLFFLLIGGTVLARTFWHSYVSQLFRAQFAQQTSFLFQQIQKKASEKKPVHFKMMPSSQSWTSSFGKSLRKHVIESSMLLRANISVRGKDGLCFMEAIPSYILSRRDFRRLKRLKNLHFHRVMLKSESSFKVKQRLLSILWVEDQEGKCLENRLHWYKSQYHSLPLQKYELKLSGTSSMTLFYRELPRFRPHRFPKFFAISFLVLFLATGVLIVLLSRNVTLPLRRLTKAVKKMEDGDLGHTLCSPGLDEVGDLSRAIDSMQKWLLRLQKERSQLTSDLSHEIRTPLARIRTVAESVADGMMREPDVLTRAMEGLCTQVDEVDLLLGDLLEVARFDLKQQAGLERSLTDLEPVLEQVSQAFEADANANEMFFEYKASQTPLPKFSLDIRRVRQVLNNLMQNAIRYSPKEARIELAIYLQDDAVLFELSDQGEGVPGSEREKIFERLYRIDRSRSRLTGGQGLGLAIVKQIVEAHGGKVGVRDAEMGGATFWFVLPIG